MTITSINSVAATLVSPVRPLEEARKGTKIIDIKTQEPAVDKKQDVVEISAEAATASFSGQPVSEAEESQSDISTRIQQLLGDFVNGTGLFEAGKSPSGFFERLQFLFQNIQQVTQGKPLLTYNEPPKVTPLYVLPGSAPSPAVETTTDTTLESPVKLENSKPTFFSDITPLNPKKGSEIKNPPVIGLLPPLPTTPTLVGQSIGVSKASLELELLQKGELFA